MTRIMLPTNPPKFACSVCVFAAREGWWGPTHRGTHCRGCHRSWTAGSHCYACHRHFSSGTGFDTHQRGGVCSDIVSQLSYACNAPRFRLVEGTVTGTVHAAFGEGCRDWTKCA